MKKTTIYLPEDLALAVSQCAKQAGRSEASLIREAIAGYVATLEKPRPRTFGVVADGTVPAREIEDWLAQHWRPE